MRKLLVVLLLAFAGSLFVAVPTVEAKPVPVHKTHKKPAKKQKKKKHHHVYHHHHRHATASVA